MVLAQIGISVSSARLDAVMGRPGSSLITRSDLFRFHAHGDQHPETSASTGTIGHRDVAAVCEHDGSADGESQTMPRQVRLLRELLAEKWRENALSVLRRDARPVIVHRKLQYIFWCELGSDTNGRTRLQKLDDVAGRAVLPSTLGS